MVCDRIEIINMALKCLGSSIHLSRDAILPAKVCPVCKETKELSEYYRRKTGRGAGKLISRCKSCANAITSRQSKLMYQNPEYRAKRIADASRWNRDNKEKRNARLMRYYYANPELYLTRIKDWQARNRLRCLQNNSRWAKNHPETINQKNKRQQDRMKGGRVTHKDWLAIIERQSEKCNMCGEKKKLTMDHIIPLSKGGPHCPDNIQGLCLPCNLFKGDRILDANMGLRVPARA